MRVAALAALSTLFTLLTVTGGAQAEPPPPIRTVGVLPVLDYARDAKSLWAAPDIADEPRETAVQRYLLQRLALEPRVKIVTAEEIVSRVQGIKAHREAAPLGLERMKLGMDLYKALRVEEAIPHLEQALAILTSAYHDVVAPKVMAELSLTLAQCYLERKDPHRAHVAFKEMFLRAPDSRFRRGFYSVEVEEALASALVDFVATYPKENPLLTPARLDRFAQEIDVDVLIIAYLEPGEAGPGIRIVVYDRHSRNVSYRGGFASTGQADDLERVDRFVTRWTTCLPDEVGPPKPPEKTPLRFFLDTNFAYSMFLKDTIRNRIHNFGMGLAAELQFSSSLGVFLQVNMFSSTQDKPNEDLVDNFTSVRATGGIVYSLRGARWRTYVRLGVIEAHFLGAYTTTVNKNCNFFGEGDPLCSGENDVKHLGNEATFGANAAIGGQLFLGKDLYLNTRFGYTVYAFPQNASIALNHPITMEMGLGYTF